MTPFLAVLESLERNGVEYVLVGGLAVILHGYVRATTDLDLVIHLTPDNTAKAIDTLLAAGLRPRAPVDAREFADPAKRREWIERKNMIVFSFFHKDHPMNDIDIFVQHPMDFQAMRNRSVSKNLGKFNVHVCGIDDLIELKKRAGRAKDLLDIEKLQAIKNAEP